MGIQVGVRRWGGGPGQAGETGPGISDFQRTGLEVLLQAHLGCRGAAEPRALEVGEMLFSGGQAAS